MHQMRHLKLEQYMIANDKIVVKFNIDTQHRTLYSLIGDF